MTTTFLILLIIGGWSIASFAVGVVVGKVLAIVSDTALYHAEPAPPEPRKLRAVK